MPASMTFIAASMTSHAGPHGVFMQERRRLAGWLCARPRRRGAWQDVERKAHPQM